MAASSVLASRRARALGGWAVVVALVVFVLVLPRFGSANTLFFWETVATEALFALSVNVLFGEVGVPSFGQAAFFGGGAYAVGMAMEHHWPLLAAAGLAVAVGGVLAALAGLLLGRLGGLAFAMVTLAVAQAMYELVLKVSTFGSYNGIADVLPTKLGPFNLVLERDFWFFVVVVVGIGAGVLYWVHRSPFGHALRAIRQDPVRARFLGLDVTRYRLGAFVIAGATAGLAGGLYALVYTVVSPQSLYWTTSAQPIIMALVGGMGVFAGPVLGAALLTWLSRSVGQSTVYYDLYLGLILLFVLLVMPEGILGLGRPGAAPRRLAAFLRRRRPRPRPDAPPAAPETSSRAPAAVAPVDRGGS